VVGTLLETRSIHTKNRKCSLYIFFWANYFNHFDVEGFGKLEDVIFNLIVVPAGTTDENVYTDFIVLPAGTVCAIPGIIVPDPSMHTVWMDASPGICDARRITETATIDSLVVYS
jgi:hypothetical protein